MIDSFKRWSIIVAVLKCVQVIGIGTLISLKRGAEEVYPSSRRLLRSLERAVVGVAFD